MDLPKFKELPNGAKYPVIGLGTYNPGLWCTHHNPKDIKENCQKSLQRLQVGYVQLYIIHWPMAMKDGDALFPKDANGKLLFAEHHLMDTWKGMEELVDCGMVENIGLSNFNKSQIERILKIARIKPCNHQLPWYSIKQ